MLLREDHQGQAVLVEHGGESFDGEVVGGAAGGVQPDDQAIGFGRRRRRRHAQAVAQSTVGKVFDGFDAGDFLALFIAGVIQIILHRRRRRRETRIVAQGIEGVVVIHGVRVGPTVVGGPLQRGNGLVVVPQLRQSAAKVIADKRIIRRYFEPILAGLGSFFVIVGDECLRHLPHQRFRIAASRRRLRRRRRCRPAIAGPGRGLGSLAKARRRQHHPRR